MAPTTLNPARAAKMLPSNSKQVTHFLVKNKLPSKVSCADDRSYTKSVSAVLDEDVSDPAVLVEELLDVSFADVVRQVAQKNSAPFS